MDCAECELLADQAAVAEEEVQKIRERIVAGLSSGSAGPLLIKALEAAERTQERCMAAVERHAQSHRVTRPLTGRGIIGLSSPPS